jgi:hypothetical protein
MKKFKNKNELIEFVKHQLNIELKNEDTSLNKMKKVLYTEIKRNIKNPVLMLLNKYKIRYEEHSNDYYYIYL